MADEAGIMFSGGKATPLLVARWRAKGGVFQPQASATYLEADRSATTVFRALWRVAFPNRSSLPPGPLAEADGRFTAQMLNVWN